MRDGEEDKEHGRGPVHELLREESPALLPELLRACCAAR